MPETLVNRTATHIYINNIYTFIYMYIDPYLYGAWILKLKCWEALPHPPNTSNDEVMIIHDEVMIIQVIFTLVLAMSQ